MLLFSSSARSKHLSRIVYDNASRKEEKNDGKFKPYQYVDNLTIAINTYLDFVINHISRVFFNLITKPKHNELTMDTGPSFRTYCER